MNFGQLKTKVAAKNLGRTSTDDLDAAGEAINWLLTEHLPIKGMKPFLVNTVLNTVASQEYVELPTDFAGLKIAQILETDDYTTMSDATWEDMEVYSDGKPYKKRILPASDKWRMYLRYVPDDVYDIKIWYYAKQLTLDDDNDVPTLSTIYGDAVIISGATWRMAAEIGSDVEASRWYNIFDKVDLPNLLTWQSFYNLDGYNRERPTRNPYK